MKTIKPALSVLLMTCASAAAVAAVAADLSTLNVDGLHDIQLPPPGEFRLLIKGETFEGSVTGQHGLPPVCQADEDYHPGRQVKTFQFAQTIVLENNRTIQVGMSRMLSRSEGSWNRFMGHENDQIELTLSGAPEARSRLLVRRVRPGEAPYRVGEVGSADAGPYELPMVRVVAGDALAATAVGELYALDEHPEALTGAFTLAVVCP